MEWASQTTLLGLSYVKSLSFSSWSRECHLYILSSGVASYGALGHLPPSTSNNLILVHFRVNLTANYPGSVYARRACANVKNSQFFSISKNLLH